MAVGTKLKELGIELDKYQRGDDRYLVLVTEETKIIKDETKLKVELESCEMEERELFALLSSAVRESHEKERVRTERTKYWSIIGSIIGATIGIIGTTVNNYRKMNELRALVKSSTTSGIELREFVLQTSESLHDHQKQLQNVISDIKNLLDNPTTNNAKPVQNAVNYNVLVQHMLQMNNALLALDKYVKTEMNEIKQFYANARIASTRIAVSNVEQIKIAEKQFLVSKDIMPTLQITAIILCTSSIIIPILAYIS